jgi:transmembrane protein DUF3566
VVTSRATDDNLIDDQDTRTSDIMAPPRQPSRKSAPGRTDTAKPGSAKAAPAKNDGAASDGTAGAGVSPNGTPAGGTEEAPANGAAANRAPAAAAKDAAAKDRARPAAGDTVADGVPALPADTVGSSRTARPKGSGADRGAAAGKDQPTAQSSVGDSPVLSFGPPPAAPARPAIEDPTIAYPAESAAKPASDDPKASGAASPAAPATPAAGRPAQADPPSVSPAAFAWEMPDPPPNSPSSPARTFLRSGTAAKNPPAPKTGPPKAGSPPRGDGKAAAAKSQAAASGAAQKASGIQLKRTARQAHLTVARVEPWSVMKFSFVVSLVAFVILFVAVSVLYGALAGLGVFDSLQRVVSDVTSSQGSTGVNAKAWFSASRVLGYTALLGSLNIVLITAMSTIGAVVYNLTSRLVGGVEVTLKETE